MRNLICTILFTLMSPALLAATLNFSVSNLRSGKGNIQFILFESSDGFPDKAELGLRQGIIPAVRFQSPSYQVELRDLPPGRYAIAIIHDENSNGKLDTNMVGIPKEGFGFSNNPKVTFGPPSFERASFEIKDNQSINIELKHF
jgi:uncharacterized protein (DUF2141 family)